MPYYKRQENELLCAPNGVEGPGFSLTLDNHQDHTYPVSGWFWFDTLDAAMALMPKENQSITVSPLQFSAALLHFGLYDQVDSFVTQTDKLTQLAWQKATEFKSDSPMLLNAAAQLGVTENQLNQIFSYALTVSV